MLVFVAFSRMLHEMLTGEASQETYDLRTVDCQRMLYLLLMLIDREKEHLDKVMSTLVVTSPEATALNNDVSGYNEPCVIITYVICIAVDFLAMRARFLF